MPVQHRQSLPIAQHLNLQDILELRRQVVRRHARQQADRLLGLEKFSRGLGFAQTRAEKISQY